MKLVEALDQVDNWTDPRTWPPVLEITRRVEDTIFARRPWRLDSEALIVPLALDENFRTPQYVKDQQFEYFLEFSVAREVLADAFGAGRPSLQERREVLLHFAEHDGLPKWVHDRGRLERILSRRRIVTPDDLRVAQDRLDSVADDAEKGVLLRIIEEYYRSHPKSSE
jgi:hypothetical protein